MDLIRVGDLNEQIRLGTSGLAVTEAAPRIRVRLGSRARTDACELWGLAGRKPVLQRLCALPAGVAMRLRLVEKAIENAGFGFQRTDDRLHANWRRLHAPGPPSRWFELNLELPQTRSRSWKRSPSSDDD